MDENDPIYKAIDLGGGQTCDIPGVVRELAKAGYVIRKVGEAGASPQDQALDVVRSIAAAHGANNGETVDRMVIRIFANGWINAVRAEWQAYVDADPELKAQHEIAVELMREDCFEEGLDPICMMPGQKAFIAKVDNQEAVCVDYCMAQVMPLSSIYVNRVRLVQSAAARVAERLAKEAAKDPNQEWPIKTAAGEVFNSIEEMKASPNEFIRGLAEAMEKGGEARAAAVAGWLHPDVVKVDAGLIQQAQSDCWRYFGFDGPTNLHNLQLKYHETVAGFPLFDSATLAAEAHRQYQNCLRELGAAIMSGSETTERGSQ